MSENAPREAADREAARVAFRLAYLESKAVCATCGLADHVARFYRCRWCGLYYCPVCSCPHFAPEGTQERREATEGSPTMTLFVYLLERTFNDYPEIVKSTCRLVKRMVVCARSEEAAREVAASSALVEGADLWKDSAKSTVTLISSSSTQTTPVVLCREG